MSTLLECDGTWTVDGDGAVHCDGVASALDSGYAALLLSGGFDADAASTGFLAVITLFVLGLGVGLIVQVIRRLRG